MVMISDVVPGLKRCFSSVVLSDAARAMVFRVIVAFIMHAGRMSCLQSARAIRSNSRHRAQVGRFLEGQRWKKAGVLSTLQKSLVAMEAKPRGRWVFIVDSTLCSQSGQKTENTYSTGNRQRRPRKGRRYNKNKHVRRSCHHFLCGLLISPSGIRTPFRRPLYTKSYCKQKELTHRTPADLAAELIRALPTPRGARVIVLGDTAFDSKQLRAACDERGFSWIVPINSERVLAGGKPRPKVRSLIKDLAKVKLHRVRFAPGRGKYVEYRRLSPYRVGPKAKPRTFYVHEESRDVHSVGEVRLVFSTRKSKLTKSDATADHVKILMTRDARLSVHDVVELYSLRWQIELFFRELKSTLGFHQYQFRRFGRVEGWVELALATYGYLEWYRATQLKRRGLSDKERRWWSHQRTHGLCQAVRQAAERSELNYVADRLETDGGIRKLKRTLRDSVPREYRTNT